MISAQQLNALDPQMRQAMLSLMGELAARDEQLRAKDVLIAQRERDTAFKQALIDKLTHELAVLKRLKFAATSERFASTLAPEQKSLLEETLDADLAELQREMSASAARVRPGQGQDREEDAQAHPAAAAPAAPRCGARAHRHHLRLRAADAAHRPGRGREAGLPAGRVHGERHVRGKWACRCCQKLVQAPVPAHVIDKGIPTAGLLAHLLVAKFMDHLPLYRQEHIFERAGHLIARSTLAQWVGECGAQLQPLVQALARRAAPPCGAARRRDAGGHAQAQAPARRQDAQGLHLVVLHHQRQPDEGGGVRVQRRPQRRERARVPQAEHAPTPGRARWSPTASAATRPASTRA
jgi:transposase